MLKAAVILSSRVSLLATIAFVAIVSVVSTTVYVQVAQVGAVVVDAEASGPRVSLMNLDVNLDPFTLRPAKGASPATRLAMRSGRFVQAPASTRPGTRARSKKRIIAGAIIGSVGGFFAGGFLGAHIEGDRCNCDDPGVRGFLIGAPIGTVAGGIAGARFLFSSFRRRLFEGRTINGGLRLRWFGVDTRTPNSDSTTTLRRGGRR